MIRLLLLEDDANLQETLCDFLEEQGFAVDAFYDGLDAHDALYERTYDLLILDVNTPNLNGFELLKAARKEGTTTPAIYTTSRNGLDDLEEGFASGCDDYIRKPFALKELLIRIQSLLKRDFFHATEEHLRINTTTTYDTQTRTLFVDNNEHHLQDKEHKLLTLFLKHPNQTLSHETIFDTLWEYDQTPSDSALRTYIKNLRQLLGKEKLVSIKRIGYEYRP